MDDEFLIAMAIEETLSAAGADVMSASTLANSLKIAQDEPLAAAVLDFRLGHQTSEAVAETLAKRSVSFVFYSGQMLPDQILNRYSNIKVMTKPIRQEVLLKIVLGLIRN